MNLKQVEHAREPDLESERNDAIVVRAGAVMCASVECEYMIRHVVCKCGFPGSLHWTGMGDCF